MNNTWILAFFLVLSSGATLYSQTNHTKEFQDIPYMDLREMENDSLQRLNLVIPAGEPETPLLIWIGGGAWSYTDRAVEMEFARRMAENGIAVASIGHRLSPATWRNPAWTTGVQHPAHIEDLAHAVRWLYDHADEYGYDRDNLFIGGYSSGAHLATLLCLDPTYLGEVSLSPNIFKGILPFSGAFDISGYHQGFIDRGQPEMAEAHVEAVFGDNPAAWKQASPVNYLDNLKTPMLILCDNNLYAYTRLFEDRLRATSFRKIQVMYAYDLSHAGLWRELSNKKSSIYRQATVAFIRENANGLP